MRLKLDENLSGDLAALFATRGHDVETAVGDGLGGADDPRVIEAARQKGRALVTLDRGFGDITTYLPDSHPGIFVVRIDPPRPSLIRAALTRLLDQGRLDALAGCIVIVQLGALRVRRPASGS